MKLPITLLTTGLLFGANLMAQKPVITKQEIRKKIQGGLNYLEKTQRKETSGTDYFKGEWSSTIRNESPILFIGKRGKSAEDSNCFTASLVHNTLAEIYLQNPEWKSIPSMLDLALENIMLFKHGETFKFWHVMNREEYISRAKHFRNPEKYRQSRPNHFQYRSRYINSYANLYDDADDTAAALAAIKLNNKVHSLSGNPGINEPDSIGYLFSRYRDRKRRNFNWYNLFYGLRKRTDAYMTWFAKERIASPWCWFAPRGKFPNLPYGSNDVCPIVNANILRTLGMYDETDNAGVTESCALIDRLINKKNNTLYSVYYPTEFNFEYAVISSIKAGAPCLDSNIQGIVSRIIDNQLPDGSWKTRIIGNELQATLYAVGTLLKLGEYEKHKSMDTIERGMVYILDAMKTDSDSFYWKGGVFFSGGTMIKKTHVWRSNAYTTALAIEILNAYLMTIDKSVG